MQVSEYSFRATEIDGARPRTFVLEGTIDEDADLSFLLELRAPTRIVLRGVRRINSFGVRSWVESMRRIPPEAPVEFVDCPPPLVDQINLIYGFLGSGKLTSFGVPYICDTCGEERDHYVDVQVCRSSRGELPTIPCRCGQQMVPDLLESLLRHMLEQVK